MCLEWRKVLIGVELRGRSEVQNSFVLLLHLFIFSLGLPLSTTIAGLHVVPPHLHFLEILSTSLPETADGVVYILALSDSYFKHSQLHSLLSETPERSAVCVKD